MLKYCLLLLPASDVLGLSGCMPVCVCVCLCSPVSEWHCQLKEQGNDWDFVCRISRLWSPRPSYGISFCASLLIWFFSASRTAPPANELHNIHLVQHCCCGAAGCQPLPLIAPVSHVEARGGKRKKKESECVVNLSDKLDTETIVRKKTWQKTYFLGLWLDFLNPTSELMRKTREKFDLNPKYHTPTPLCTCELPHKSLNKTESSTFDVKIQLRLQLRLMPVFCIIQPKSLFSHL